MTHHMRISGIQDDVVGYEVSVSSAPRSMTQLLSASPYMVRTGDPASQPGIIVLSSPDLSNCHSGLVTDNWQYWVRETRAHNNIQIHIIVSLQIGPPMDHIKRGEHCVRQVSSIVSPPPCHSLGMRCLPTFLCRTQSNLCIKYFITI